MARPIRRAAGVVGPDDLTSPEFLDLVLDHARVAIIATTVDGRITYANRQAERLYGRSRAEVVGSDASQYAEPVGPEVTTQIGAALLAGETFEFEFTVRRPDGSTVPVWVRDVGVYDAEGGLVGVIAMSTDIAERRAIEVALSQTQAHMQAIVEAALDGIVMVDSAGAISGFNPAACAIFGWEASEVLGRDLAEVLIPPSLRAAHRAGWRRYLETGEPRILGRRVEMRALRRNGEEFPVELAITRIGVPGPAVFSAHIRDITARRQAERQLIESRERYAELADTLQAALLPAALPDVPGFEVAAHYQAAGGADGALAVGGDFYDVFETRRGDWALAIGDVQGKDAAAASLTALARHTVRAAAMRDSRPRSVLQSLNDAVLLQHPERFLTAVYARLRWRAGTAHLTVGVAGHPLPLRISGSRVVPTGRIGQLLGVVREVVIREAAVKLEPGDAVVLYTDGVIEARGPDGSLFGEERLVAVLSDCSNLDAGGIAATVGAEVERFSSGSARDDLAILVLRRLAADAGPVPA